MGLLLAFSYLWGLQSDAKAKAAKTAKHDSFRILTNQAYYSVLCREHGIQRRLGSMAGQLMLGVSYS